jgi:hypothetical protein
MERLVIAISMGVALSSCAGCGLGPRNFRKIAHPAPLVRARAMSLGYEQSDAVVLPALVSRLDDNDVVVRLAAHEELKRRTGRDFGYVPWVSAGERAGSVSRWRSWLNGEPIRQAPVPAPARPKKSLPRPSPQGGAAG